jgi:hypothetical protein
MLTREPSGSRASTIGDDVDAPSQRRHDSLDDPQDVVVVPKSHGTQIQAPFLLVEHGVRRVDHDFRDVRIAQQRLDRPETQHLVGNRRHEFIARRADDAGHLLAMSVRAACLTALRALSSKSLELVRSSWMRR